MRFTPSVLLLLFAFSAVPAHAQKDSQQDSPPSVMDDVGTALKSAIRSGAMDRSEAYALWRAIAAELNPSSVQGKDGEAERAEEHTIRINGFSVRVRRLLEPDYLRRDLVLIREALALDQAQSSIAESLLLDHIDLFEIAATPLREAFLHYRGARRDKRVARILEQANMGEISGKVLQAVEQYGQRKAQERAAKSQAQSGSKNNQRDAGQKGQQSRLRETEQSKEYRQYTQKVQRALQTLRSSMSSLREQVNERLAWDDVLEDSVSANELAQLAEAFRVERLRLREAFGEHLALIANATEREGERLRFDAMHSQMRVEHGLEKGYWSGESMNLRAALVDSDLSADQMALVREGLDEQQWVIADLIERRDKARVDREVESLKVIAIYDRAVEAGVDSKSALSPSDTRRYIQAGSEEMAASIKLRDELLNQLDLGFALLGLEDEAAAARFRQAALVRGFPSEMRRIWSERVFDSVFELEGLNDETYATLFEVQVAVADRVRPIREESLAERLERDEDRVRQWLTGLQGQSSKDDQSESQWREASRNRYNAYVATNDFTEENLLALLSAEQMEALPRRPDKRRDDKKDNKDNKDKKDKKDNKAKAAGGKGAKQS